jgi:hypothetical protein
MDQQFLRRNEERRVNVSEIDNVVPRAGEALATLPRGLLNLPYAPTGLRQVQPEFSLSACKEYPDTGTARSQRSKTNL